MFVIYNSIFREYYHIADLLHALASMAVSERYVPQGGILLIANHVSSIHEVCCVCVSDN